MYFSLVALIVALFSPASSWGFYYSQVVSNIYAENFNFDTYAAFEGKGLFFYLVLMRSLSLICNIEPIVLTHIASASSIVMVIFVYVYFLSQFPGDKWLKVIVGIIYPIGVIIQSMSYWFGYVLPYSVILMLLIVSILFYKTEVKTRIQTITALVILWVALGLYWHSFQVLTLGIILSLFVTNLIQINGRKKTKYNFILIFLMLALFVITWVYLREQTLYNLLSIPHIEFDISSLFNKGSFTGDCTYESFFDPLWKLNFLRYIGYLVSFGVMGVFTTNYIFHILKREEIPKYLQIFVILFISDVIFMVLYFIATRETAPRILSVISLPLLLIILNNDTKIEPDIMNNKSLRKVITVILICSMCSATPYAIYSYFEETAEKNIDMENFKSSLNWTLDYIPRSTIVSNSHTCGNYMLLYGYFAHWIGTQRISFKDMTHRDYLKLATIEYDNPEDEILVIGDMMYVKHLKQESIQYWNVYDPLPPACTDVNSNLTKLYSDGTVIVYI